MTDYLEAGDYIKAETNAGGTIHLKTVEIDGEMAFISPFSSKVMEYRFDKQTTVKELDKFFKAKCNAYPTKVIETVDVCWHIDEEPVAETVEVETVESTSLKKVLKHKLRQLI